MSTESSRWATSTACKRSSAITRARNSAATPAPRSAQRFGRGRPRKTGRQVRCAVQQRRGRPSRARRFERVPVHRGRWTCPTWRRFRVRVRKGRGLFFRVFCSGHIGSFGCYCGVFTLGFLPGPPLGPKMPGCCHHVCVRPVRRRIDAAVYLWTPPADVLRAHTGRRLPRHRPCAPVWGVRGDAREFALSKRYT